MLFVQWCRSFTPFTYFAHSQTNLSPFRLWVSLSGSCIENFLLPARTLWDHKLRRKPLTPAPLPVGRGEGKNKGRTNPGRQSLPAFTKPTAGGRSFALGYYHAAPSGLRKKGRANIGADGECSRDGVLGPCLHASASE